MSNSSDSTDSTDEQNTEECCIMGLVRSSFRLRLWPNGAIPKEMFKPPPPTYTFGAESEYTLYMIFHEKCLASIYESWKNMIDCSCATTREGSEIACFLFKPVSDAQFTILYSHGNCSDIGSDLPFCVRLGLLVECNVFTYDYSGYGSSSGCPSQKNVLADIKCAWGHLKKKYGVLEERVILYGRGLGAVPTVELAAKKTPAAVILLSPLTSAKNVAVLNLTRNRNRHLFKSIDKLSMVTSPILVIHGVNDRVINLSHAVSIYNKYPKKIDPLWIHGAGHEDVQFNVEYLKRMMRFAEELGVSLYPRSLKAKVDYMRKTKLFI